jgi:hypothetical protein
LAELAGVYRTVAAELHVTVVDTRLELREHPSAQFLEQLGDDADEGNQPATLGLVAVDEDRWMITDGPGEGGVGTFIRDSDERVTALHAWGRHAVRVDST